MDECDHIIGYGPGWPEEGEIHHITASQYHDDLSNRIVFFEMFDFCPLCGEQLTFNQKEKE